MSSEKYVIYAITTFKQKRHNQVMHLSQTSVRPRVPLRYLPCWSFCPNEPSLIFVISSFVCIVSFCFCYSLFFYFNEVYLGLFGCFHVHHTQVRFLASYSGSTAQMPLCLKILFLRAFFSPNRFLNPYRLPSP